MPRQTASALGEPFRRPPDGGRVCAHPGCTGTGDYRAPMARDRLSEYYWFCLDHVREYNRGWDYFAGMNEAEIERQRRNDTVWQRPSWPLGRFGERAARYGDHIRDGFGFFSEGPAKDGGSAPNGAKRPISEEEKALALLDLAPPVTFTDVRARYRTLVKKLHPDANGGDPEAEELLKRVNQAYAALKVSLA